ncbi:N-acetylneuraminate synthase family protein [Shewanella atlantica]|uniref:Uncharacterized protein n=1 Tax=Shewanella atlantica TaxID=271099 RepID=A0A3S0KJS6_9GAMM|nr:N-acetylneuraminate synthase family protein [Shewanella atlantica]RTR32532.1 hypothetical protein EKG39_09120 [Shewanella atlantica]
MCETNQHTITIIGETAFNHEGDFDYLMNLVDLTAAAGATHIKFQVLINYDEFVSQLSEAYSLVKSWCFSVEQWNTAFDYAELLGLKLFVMPLDQKAVALCHRDSVEYIEIHSVSFNDELLLDEVNRKVQGKVIGLGIGGRTIEELKNLEQKLRHQKLLLLCGFQAFPSQLEEVKISRIKYLAKYFPEAFLGYADHSDPNHLDAQFSSHYAYQLGARVFEKHVTLKPNRTDAQSAYTGVQFKNYIESLNRYISVIEEDETTSFTMSDNEISYRHRQKKVVAIRDIAEGEVYTHENIALKMHTEEGTYSNLTELIGYTANQSFKLGKVIC